MSVAAEEIKVVEGKVKELLQALQLDVHLATKAEDKRIYFNVTGPDARHFLRNKDEILKSISLLLQTVHQHKFGNEELEIRFDANGSLLEREKEVRAMAFNATERLTKPGDVQTLEPLNPYERRIVHMALDTRKDLATESIGEGHFKRLRIRYIGGPAAAPAPVVKEEKKEPVRQAREAKPAPVKKEVKKEIKKEIPKLVDAAALLLDDGPVSDF